MPELKELQFLDYLVLALYLIVIAAIGLWAARGKKTTSRYFIADRSIPTWAVAFTLMATMISSGSIVGLPGTSYEKGMILLLGHVTLVVVLIFVAVYIVPFYRNVVRISAYEYLGMRFGLGSRVYSSLGFVVDRVFDLGITLVTTAIALHVMTGWGILWVVVGVGLFTIVYTALGGIEAVVWTNAVQGIILVSCAVLILGFLLVTPAAGPPGAVVAEAWRHGRFDLGSFEISWESLYDFEVTTQWLFIIAWTITWARRYMTDQHMVQRYLIARSDRDARVGALWGAISCVPIWLIFMFIGACLYGYYQLTPNTPAELSDEIAPHFLVNTFPAGIVGLILAAIMAASMSSMSADLNSVATVITTDYFSVLSPQSPDGRKLLFGRFAVFAVGALATIVAYLLIPEKGIKPLVERIVTILAILSGGVLGLFALGWLTRRATRFGCYVGIVVCLLFTAWGVLTAGRPGDKILDLGSYSFNMKPMMIGLFSHVVLFSAGYLTSITFGGYRPSGEELSRLTIYGRRTRRTR